MSSECTQKFAGIGSSGTDGRAARAATRAFITTSSTKIKKGLKDTSGIWIYLHKLSGGDVGEIDHFKGVKLGLLCQFSIRHRDFIYTNFRGAMLLK